MVVLLGILAVLVFGLVPMGIYALVLWWFDRYEKEPLGLLLAAFGWGAVPAIIFSLIVELVLDIPISYFMGEVGASLVGPAVVAPLVEEAFKGLALVLLFIFFRREIDSVLDGIIYGGLVGFGFAAVENVFYFGSALAESGFGGTVVLFFMRAILFGLNHALFTGLFGLGLALGRTSRNWVLKIGAPLAGLVAGMLSHGIHNASVTLGAEFVWPCLLAFVSDWGGALVLIVIMVLASVREKQWIKAFLADEVALGTLSQDDYEDVASYRRRLLQRFTTLFRGDLQRWWRLGRYYRLATELAFNKHRLARVPRERSTQTRILTLRQEVLELGERVMGNS